MNDYANTFLFGIYPYIAIAVFLVGRLARFETEQSTWKSDSSQFLSKSQLRLASNLFHLGILGILGGHFVGLLTPMPVWHALGVTPAAKQMLAIVAGGIFGLMSYERIRMSGATAYLFDDADRLTGHWQICDRLGVYQQLQRNLAIG